MTITATGHESFPRTFAAVASDPTRILDLHQRFGELCHTLKNRLQTLNLALYLSRRAGQLPPSTSERIEPHYQRLERFIDQLQWICRPADLHPVSIRLGLVVEERRPNWEERFLDRQCRIVVVEGVDDRPTWFDPNRLITALEAFTLWRHEVIAPGSLIELSWSQQDGMQSWDWVESGDRPASAPNTRVSTRSLALAMLGRVMAEQGGSLRLDDTGDFAIRLRWKTQPSPPPCSRTDNPPVGLTVNAMTA